MNLSRRSLLKGIVAGSAAAASAVVARAADGAHEVKADPDAVGLLYDATRCIGCQACVVKCREVNHLTPQGEVHDRPSGLDGDTKNVIKLLRDGEHSSFMKQQCMHCVEPACITACMLGSLHKVEHGIVAYNPDRCIGCRYCQVACPFDIPKFQWSSTAPVIVKCELCRERLAEGKLPGCVEVCPKQAVIYGKRTDLLADAHQRIADHPGRYQPKVYGEHDAGGTQSLYLAAVPFKKLGLPDLGTEPAPSLQQSIQHGIYRGFLAPTALYAALGITVWRNHRKAAVEGDGNGTGKGKGGTP